MAVAPKKTGLNILRKLIPLNTLSDAVLKSVLEQARFEKLRKGDHLFEKGDTDHYNVYLLSGRVAMLKNNREVDGVDAGSDTARFPLAHQIPRKFTVIAKTKVEIVRIDNRVLGEQLAKAGNATYEVSEFEEQETDDWMSQLLNSRVFQQIPAANIQGVMMRMQEQEVSEGEVVINYGDEGDYFYLINKGRCSVQQPNDEADGELVEVAQLGPGDSFGEEALLSDKPRGSTVVMLNHGMLLRLSKDDFVQYVKYPLARMVSALQARKLVAKGAVMLDVRSTQEYEAGHLDDSLSLPFPSLRYQMASLDPEQKYIVYCADGQQSTTAAYLLIEQGFDASVLEGGVDPSDFEAQGDTTASNENVVMLRPADDQGIDDTPADEPDQTLLAELRSALTTAQSALGQREDELQELRQAFDEAKRHQDQQRESEQSAQSDLEALREQIDQLKGELSEKSEELEVHRLNESTSPGKDPGVLQLEKSLEQAKDRIVQLQIENEMLEEQALAAAEAKGRESDQRDQLQNELQERAAELVQSEEARASLQQKLEQAESALAASTAERADLDRERDQLKQENELIATLRSENEGVRAEIETLMQERDALQQSADELATLRSENEGVRAEIETLVQERDALQQSADELATLRKEYEFAGEQLESLSREHDELQGRLAGEQSAAQELREQIAQQSAESKQQTESLEQQLSDSRAEATSAEAELDRLRQELAQLNQTHDELSAQLTERDAMAAELERLRGELETAEALKGENGTLREQLEGLERERDQLESQKSSFESRVSELEAHQQSSSESQDALSSERDQLQAKLFELEQDLILQQGLQQQLESLQAERDALISGREELNAQLDQLKAEQASREGEQADELTALRDELEQQRKALQDSETQLSNEKAELQQRVEQLQGQLETDESDKARQSEDLDQVQKQLDERQTQLDELKGELQTALDEQARLRQALEESGQQVTSLSADLETLQGELAERAEMSPEALARLQSDLQSGQDEQAALKQALDERDAEADGLRQDLQRLEAELAQKAEHTADEQAQMQTDLTLAEDARQQAEEALEAAGRHAEKVSLLEVEVESLKTSLEDSGKAFEALKQERDQAQQEIDRLTAADKQLRAVADRLADELKNIEHSGDDLSALRAEMELVREKAEDDVARLQADLRSAQESLQTAQLTGSVENSESSALKEEMTELHQQLAEHSRQKEKAEREQSRLQARLEEMRGESDQLKTALAMAQVDAEEAAFKRDEAIEAKALVDDALYKLQKDLEQERRPQQLVDDRLSSTSVTRAIDFASILGGGSTFKGLILGALLAFVAAEGLSFLSGNGELVSGFLKAGETPGPVNQQVERFSPSDAAEKSDGRPRVGVDRLQTDSAPGDAEPGPVSEQPRTGSTTPQQRSTAEPARAESARAEPTGTEPSPEPVTKGPVTGTLIRDRLASGGRAPEMVIIRGASFTMGSNRSQLEPEERPAHEVTLQSYAIGRYEVTFDEYTVFARATGRSVPDDLGWGAGKRPVINVSWEDAQAYAGWLSRETGKRYRLPTEAEWEYAAGAGSDNYFWWGYEIQPNRANCFNCGGEWAGASTAPVGTFEPNDFGLYNTAGNVLEWVEDCYHPNYSGAPSDGSAWVEPGCGERVIRGGAFNKPGDSMRVTNRSRHDTTAKIFTLGFRLARDLR